MTINHQVLLFKEEEEATYWRISYVKRKRGVNKFNTFREFMTMTFKI